MTLMLLPPPTPPAKAEVKTCRKPDCNAPCGLNKRGQPYTMCMEHQRAYWRDHAARRKRDQPAKQPHTLPLPLPVAKPPARRGRKSKPEAAPVRLMLLDYERGTVQLLELVTLQEVPMRRFKRGEPHPHTIGLYERMGYRIVETRPTQLTAKK